MDCSKEKLLWKWSSWRLLGKMSYKVEASYQKVVSSLLQLIEFLWGFGASLADMLSRRVKINCLRVWSRWYRDGREWNGNSCVDGVEPCTLGSPLKCVYPVEASDAGWKMSPMGSCSASVSPAGLEEELLSQLPLFIFFRGLLKRGLPSPDRRWQFSVSSGSEPESHVSQFPVLTHSEPAHQAVPRI